MTLTHTAEADPEKRLPLCPKSPNCVSSQARDDDHRIPPFVIIDDPDKAWAALAKTLADTPRTVVTRHAADSLHAEAASLIFRFVDDIDAVLDREEGVIHIRSASRIGYSDLGVNRKRIETLRARLQNQRVIR